MTRDEVRASADLAGRAAVGIAGHVERIHTAVARRVFRTVGPASAPVAVVHDAVAGATYRAVQGSLALAGAGAGRALAPMVLRSARPLATSRAGGLAQSVVNGVIGDDLAAGDDPLSIRMAVRLEGADVARTTEALAEAFPDARPYVVVFIHGLFESEATWRGVFADQLRADLDCTPVHLRYNTGRAVADNGAELDALLRDLVDRWPVPVRRIAVVAHSMGGLVTRCAYEHGGGDPSWLPLLSDVVFLASPHRGAQLARGAGGLGRALRLLPEVRPWAALIDHSPGIRDLERGVDVPDVPGVRQHVVWSSLDGVAGAVLGDLLVHPRSALGCEHVDALQVSGATHLSLVTHPEVLTGLRTWLSAPPEVATRPEGVHVAIGG